MFVRHKGSLFLEGVRLQALLDQGIETPFYIYSLGQVRECYDAYERARGDVPLTVAYALKANSNPAILRTLAGLSAGAVVVSDVELLHALSMGFAPQRMLLHGNGKRRRDIEAALQAGVLISLDSAFDLAHVEAAAQAMGRDARVLLRVNPDIDPRVHPYISTGLLDSKFGVPEEEADAICEHILSSERLRLVGLHCHLGSTLRDLSPLVEAVERLCGRAKAQRARGHGIEILDLGGGLDIDYQRDGTAPRPGQLIEAVGGRVRDAGLGLWLEPGRSLVGSAGALVARVIGIKHNPRKSFLVIDASMVQLIRPSLYSAYHHIDVLETERAGAERIYDVVGPICESADFLARDRLMRTPSEGDGIIIHDAGAYGFSMASRYNLHLMCAEYVVEGESVALSRRAETYDDLMRCFVNETVRV